MNAGDNVAIWAMPILTSKTTTKLTLLRFSTITLSNSALIQLTIPGFTVAHAKDTLYKIATKSVSSVD